MRARNESQVGKLEKLQLNYKHLGEAKNFFETRYEGEMEQKKVFFVNGFLLAFRESAVPTPHTYDIQLQRRVNEMTPNNLETTRISLRKQQQ